jgi:hypothetical protein
MFSESFTNGPYKIQNNGDQIKITLNVSLNWYKFIYFEICLWGLHGSPLFICKSNILWQNFTG